MRPSRGSIGSRARRRPIGVKRGRRSAPRSRAELLEQEVSVADRSPVGWLEEREIGDVAEADVRHLEDDRRQVRAQDLRLGELGPISELVLLVQADADAGSDAAASTCPLIGRRLRDRFDRQTLDLEPLAVAGDPGHAGVDHVAHARHGQRRLGDVGGEDDAALRLVHRPLEDPVLLGRRQPGVERQHLQLSAIGPRRRRASAVSWISRSPDRKTSTSPGPPSDGSSESSPTASTMACTWSPVSHRPVAHLDRIRAGTSTTGTGCRRAVRRVEVAGEAFGVDRGGGDDDLQVGALAGAAA